MSQTPPPFPPSIPISPRKTKPFAKVMAVIVGLLVVLVVIGALSEPDTKARTAAEPATPRPAAVAPAAEPIAEAVAEVTPPATEESEPDVFATREALEKMALRGDYQAQRNLAYSLGREFPVSKLQSCAWRIVILNSGSSDVDDSDVENRSYACERKLSPDVIYAAEMQAITLQEKIEARRK